MSNPSGATGQPPAATAAIIPMPMRGDRAAPRFDSSQPRTLRRFFDDLELLLARAQITDSEQKKIYARLYVPVDVSDIWEMLPECSNANKTYEEFKAAVFKLYPSADESKKWTREDLHNLVLTTMQKGITGLDDWSKFYREYYAISAYLIKKNRFSKDEQGRKIFEVLSGTVRDRVLSRLQIKAPDHAADEAYEIETLNDAVTWVLTGGGSLRAPATTATSSIAQPSSSQPTITVKSEPSDSVDLKALIEAFTKMANASSSANAIAAPVARPPPQSRPPPPSIGMNFPNANTCHYCDAEGHTLPNCPVVDADIRTGHIMRNETGRVVLPTGGFVPRSMPGRNMRERVMNWHKQFPNHLATNYMGLDDDQNVSLFLGAMMDPVPATSAPLSSSQRLEALEQEIYALRKQKFDGVYMPPRGKFGPPRAAKPAPATQPTPVATEKPESAPTATAPTAQPSVPAPPIHPFRDARDANNLPSQSEAPAAATAPRYLAPVESDHANEEVFEKLMARTPVTITVQELLSVAPTTRGRMKELCTRVKVQEPRRDPQKRPIRATMEVEEEDTAPSYPLPTPQEMKEAYEEGQRGIYVLPYETYEANIARDEEDAQIEVAPESGPLRTILAVVDNRMEVECILDPGCQIVAMSERVAMTLGLSWDPRVVLRMQSANGQVNPSLGLARNVPFQFANITIYLQVHIIREAAYDVLLGRPFDDITRSTVSNHKGGQQTITLHCPNSKLVATIPTFPRGKAKSRYQEQGF